MGNRVEVRIEGGDELLRRLRRLGVSVGDSLKVAALAGAKVIEQAANPLAPSPVIRSEVAESTKKAATVDVGPPAEKWHYRFFETGVGPHDITGSPLVFEGDEGLVVTGYVDHPGMNARPFLRPAFDAKQRQAADETGGEIKRAIDEVAS